MADPEMRLELFAVPVTDVDRAKDFYVKAGFNADHDHVVERRHSLRPAHSPGLGVLDRDRQGPHRDGARARSRASRSWWTDAEEARDALAGRGVEVSEVQEFPWGRFVYFSDPDGNGWAVQELVPQG